MLLPVSAPFHCRLLAPAAEAVAAALAEVEIRAPAVPVISNVTAAPESAPESLRVRLVEQVTARVRWRESLLAMAGLGIDATVELGAGRVLSGLSKRTVPAPPRARRARRYRCFHCRACGLIAASEACRCSIFRDGALWSPEPRAALARPSPNSCTRRVPRWCLPAGAATLTALAEGLGERVKVEVAELTDPQAAEQLIAAADGGPDVLINNAGLTRDNLALRMKDEDWQTVLEVNLTAVFRLIRAALRGMLRRRWGRIINVTSIVALTGNPGQANYAAAKAGMIGMTKSLAAEVASRGITVNCAAGFHSNADDGGAVRGSAAPSSWARAGRTARRPRRRRCRNRLSGSEEAAYVTGQTLHVNGGMAMI